MNHCRGAIAAEGLSPEAVTKSPSREAIYGSSLNTRGRHKMQGPQRSKGRGAHGHVIMRLVVFQD